MSLTKHTWIQILSQLLVFTILICLPLLYPLFGITIQVDSPVYFLADNLMLLVIPPGIALAFLANVDDKPYLTGFTPTILPVVFTASLLIVLFSFWRINPAISIVIIGYSLLIALNITALTYYSLRGLPDVVATVPDKHVMFILYVILLLIVPLSFGLRQLAPGNPALRYGFAPFIILVLPGLSLVNLILPRTASAIERLVKSIPVSIGWYAILSAWSFQSGIPVTDNLLYAFVILAILPGFAWSILQKFSTPERQS